MPAIEQFDLSVLPKQAQDELYDFYLFLTQRYIKKSEKLDANKKTHDQALERFLKTNEQRNFHVDPSIDLSALADEVSNMEF